MGKIMSDLRGVLIGCGFFAQFQMEAWNRLKHLASITAVCDTDLARAEAFARQYGVPCAYSDLTRMLDEHEPDFIDIVTRPDTHRELTLQAAERKIAVLCQKPFAPTEAECLDIVAACERLGARLMVNENWRWQVWYREIKKLLTAGRIGDPFAFLMLHRQDDGLLDPPYPNQPYFAEMPRLLVFETLVHYLDTARFLFGEPERVTCTTRRVSPRIAGEDLALIRLEMPGGLLGSIDGNRCAPADTTGPVMGSLRVEGREGSLWLDGNGDIWINRRGFPKMFHVYPRGVEGYRGDSCRATQEHFVRCLASGEEFESSGREYLKTIRLMERCYESAAENSAVR